jgi:hypothetical protein
VSGEHFPDESIDGAADTESPPLLRLRNLTGRELNLICRSEDGLEGFSRIPADSLKIRVKYNRFFGHDPVDWYADPVNPARKVPILEAKPRPGLLSSCEVIDGLPAPEGGVRLIVDPAIVFALARRGIFRRDLLTLGWARRDTTTHRVVGFESLSLVNFDDPPQLAEVSSLQSYQPDPAHSSRPLGSPTS